MIIYYGFLFFLWIVQGLLVTKSTYDDEEKLAKINNVLFWIFTIALTLLVGLRATSVGADTAQYKFRYDNYMYMLQDIRYSSEFGFNYFNYVFNKLGVPWQIYLLITSFIICFTRLLFFKKYSKNLYFCLFLFMTIGPFSMIMSGIRQTLAVSFCLIAFMLLETDHEVKRKKTRLFFAIVLWLLAISFHNSSTVFAVYFVLRLLKLRLSKNNVIFLTIIAASSLIYGKYILWIIRALSPAKYTYISLDTTYAINPLIIVIAIMITVFNAIYLQTEDDEKYDKRTSILFIFSILNILFTCLSIYQGQLGRLTFYFTNANFVLISRSIDDMTERNRLLVLPILVLICLAYFYLGNVDGTMKIDQYSFFWQV